MRGKRGVAPDTVLRLSQALGTSAEFWLSLQQEYNLDCARELFGKNIKVEVSRLMTG